MEDDESDEGAMQRLAQTLERAVSSIGAEVVTLSRRVSDLNRRDLERARDIFALERLLMALALRGAQLAEDRVQYLDQLRRTALDPIPLDEKGSTDGLRETLERALAKIEAQIVKLGPRA